VPKGQSRKVNKRLYGQRRSQKWNQPVRGRIETGNTVGQVLPAQISIPKEIQAVAVVDRENDILREDTLLGAQPMRCKSSLRKLQRSCCGGFYQNQGYYAGQGSFESLDSEAGCKALQEYRLVV